MFYFPYTPKGVLPDTEFMVDSCLLSQLERFCYHFSAGLQFQNKNPQPFELVFTYSQCTFLSVFFLQVFALCLQIFNYNVFHHRCFWIYAVGNSLSFLDMCLVPYFESLKMLFLWKCHHLLMLSPLILKLWLYEYWILCYTGT